MPPKTRSHPRRRAKKAPKKAKKAVSFAIDTAPAPRVDPVEEVLSNQPLLEHVLSFLPMNVDIGRAASTNKAFKEACDSPAMWKARAERLPILTLRDCDVDYHSSEPPVDEGCGTTTPARFSSRRRNTPRAARHLNIA